MTKKIIAGINQKSLNIKISNDLDSSLKALRKRSREMGVRFNVSALVEEFLKKAVETASDELLELSLKQKKEEQLDLYSEDDSFDDFCKKG
jgi:hypothetical protein